MGRMVYVASIEELYRFRIVEDICSSVTFPPAFHAPRMQNFGFLAIIYQRA